MPNITKQLANFVANLSFKGLPTMVIDKGKLCILDTLGVMLAGVPVTSSKIMADFVKGLGGKEESIIIGHRERVPSPHAALANGTAAHCLDFDDWHSKGAVHPGCIVVPAALALAERENVSGKDFLTSVLVGYEVMIRVGMGCLGTGFERGFHPTGTCGPFGAATSACKILGLNADKTANAFGLAGSQGAGLMEFQKSDGWVKRMHAGWAALGGVVSALLAKSDYTGPVTVLEGEYGFCKAYSSKYDLNAIVEKLGEEFELMNLQFKIYPCCSELFSSIDAALEIVRRHKIKPEDVEKVRVRSITIASKLCSEPRDRKCQPQTVVDAQFSLPYCVAAAIVKGKVSIAEYTDEAIKNPKIIGLARKVETIVDPELDKMFPGQAPAIVEITTKSGEEYSYRVNNSKGTPADPLTEEELKDKFKTCAQQIFEETRVEKLISAIMKLEELKNIKELTELLRL